MNHLKSYIREKNISSEKFVEIINSRYPKAKITDAAMYKWISGERNPSVKSAYWISKATNNELKIIDILFPPKRLAELEDKLSVGSSG